MSDTRRMSVDIPEALFWKMYRARGDAKQTMREWVAEAIAEKLKKKKGES